MKFNKSFLILLGALPCLVWGQSYRDKKGSVVREVGKPVVMTFEESQNQLELKVVENVVVLSTDIILTENSCAPSIGQKARLFIPSLRRDLIAVWKKHPTKAGQVAVKPNDRDQDENDGRDRTNEPQQLVVSENIMFSRVHKGYDENLKLVPTETKGYEFLKKYPESFGWIECYGKCKKFLPQSNRIVFWDENFEFGNEEIGLVKTDRTNTTNQITARLQDIEVTLVDNKVFFKKPNVTQGLATVFTPGISYQLQWNIKDKNILEPSDEMCQLKWDIDFTAIFNQFTMLDRNFSEPDRIDVKSLRNYELNSLDDKHPELDYLFDYRWKEAIE